jgi:hypothetical protein
MPLSGMTVVSLTSDWNSFRKCIPRSHAHYRILNPLRVFVAIQQSVVFSLDGFPIEFSSSFGLMQLLSLPCFTQHVTIGFGNTVQNKNSPGHLRK